ncbi:MAG: hypothetical protein Q9M20_05800 [Mariprofundaceae bacterium]|nr:hypothetical protein [Mariprofundaceae bacterium]
MHGGFIDLRMHRKQQGDEGFWPSFTDIMTVILMIFLLAMLTLLIRNMDLVKQLRASLQAEQQASTDLASSSSQNTSLHEHIQALENEVAMMRMRLMDMDEERDQLKQSLAQSQKADAQHQIQEQQWQQTTLTFKQRIQALNDKILTQQAIEESLQQRFTLQADAYAQLQQQNILQTGNLEHLQSEHTNLEKKYQKLIRPARSVAGKFVVMVRYKKIDGILTIDIKSPKQKQYQRISALEMHRTLSAFQKQHQKNLYVKIVFPEDSALSYNEAWNLTESLLRMYDYYYQQ